MSNSPFSSGIKGLTSFQQRKVEGNIESLDCSSIRVMPQVRQGANTGFTEESINELAASIKAEGQIQPAIVRRVGEELILVAGERRYRACEQLGIPLKCVVRTLTDNEARRIQITENIQREALSLYEVSLALQADFDRLKTQAKVAQLWSKSPMWVSERLRIVSVIQHGGAAASLVTGGHSADVTTINEMARLEEESPAAAAEILRNVEIDDAVNLRALIKAARKELKEPVQQEPVQQEPVQQEPVQQEPVQQEPVQQDPVQRFKLGADVELKDYHPYIIDCLKHGVRPKLSFDKVSKGWYLVSSSFGASRQFFSGQRLEEVLNDLKNIGLDEININLPSLPL